MITIHVRTGETVGNDGGTARWPVAVSEHIAHAKADRGDVPNHALGELCDGRMPHDPTEADRAVVATAMRPLDHQDESLADCVEYTIVPTPVVHDPLIRAQAAAWSATLPASRALVPMCMDIATQPI